MRRLLALLVAATAPLLAVPAPARAISGGEEAEPGAWPWQVALVIGGEAYCGGSLVALDVVVTAAHCTDGIGTEDITVVAGTVDLDAGGQRRDVARVLVHEGYRSSDVRDDIALLELVGPFPASDAIAPAAVPDLRTSLDLTAGGTTVTVTGFGATSESGDSSRVLRQAEVAVVDDGTCVRRYAADGDDVTAATQVCAGHDRGHIDACFGDSGGPLVAPVDDAWYLVGVVSWGAGCGRPLRPTVYTEIAAYGTWLADHGALGIDGERHESTGGLRLPALGTRGKAGPYPSAVHVGGFAGDLAGIAVELHGLVHQRPEDLDVRLQAPDGSVVTLLSDVGGAEPVNGVDVVVRPDAPPGGDRPLTLTVAPTEREADPEQRRVARASLGRLGGIDPNGEWRLLVYDDRRGASGTLAGWTLVLQR